MPNERRYSNELNLESVGINLPYNMQAEQSVLGAVLLKPDTLTDLVEILKPEMFYTRQNAQIWTEMHAPVLHPQYSLPYEFHTRHIFSLQAFPTFLTGCRLFLLLLYGA